MKKILTLATLTTSLLAAARAGQTTVPLNPGAVTNLVWVQNYTSAGLTFQYNLTGAGTNPVSLYLYGSMDGVVFSQTPSYIVSLPANGTNTVNLITNLDVNNMVCLSLVATNANASAVTNEVLNYSVKNTGFGR